MCYIHRKSMLPRTKPLKVQTIVVISEAYTGNLRRYQSEEGIQREMFSFERLFQWSCRGPAKLAKRLYPWAVFVRICD